MLLANKQVTSIYPLDINSNFRLTTRIHLLKQRKTKDELDMVVHPHKPSILGSILVTLQNIISKEKEKKEKGKNQL